ncbi:hypothetical protein ONZ45_g10966 [Pleurotus djamor]|nr:hypothetical protein ONZ45_g10966 [Pleurotus djamor]
MLTLSASEGKYCNEGKLTNLALRCLTIFLHQPKRLLFKFLGILITDDGAVIISHQALIADPLSLGPSIEKAFGSHPTSLGIIIVKDLPGEYQVYRERLLKLAYGFAQLEDSVKEGYVDVGSRFSFGWSHGKVLELFSLLLNALLHNTYPDAKKHIWKDLLKGSYYANPAIDKPTVSSALRETYPEYYGDNIWPDPGLKGIEGFEEAFKDLGRFVFKVGVEMAAACQPFGVFPLSPSTFMVKALLTPLSFVASNIYSKALSHLSDQSVSLPALISSSQTNKARLLHYFPPTAKVDEEGEEDEPIDNWCGMHCDHSLLTGLCSAVYLRQDSKGEVTTVPPPCLSSGLYIKTRGGDLTKVTIPPDCLAFQTGESLQLATGGRLRATPHCVRAGLASDDLDLEAGRVSRETFAVFMGPDVDQRLTETLTFGEFSKQVFDEHYN